MSQGYCGALAYQVLGMRRPEVHTRYKIPTFHVMFWWPKSQSSRPKRQPRQCRFRESADILAKQKRLIVVQYNHIQASVLYFCIAVFCAPPFAVSGRSAYDGSLSAIGSMKIQTLFEAWFGCSWSWGFWVDNAVYLESKNILPAHASERVP